MSQPHKAEDLARRDLLRLGLAGASMLVLGSVHIGYAGEMQMPMPGVERKVLKEVGLEHSRICQNPHARCDLSAGFIHAHDDDGKRYGL